MDTKQTILQLSNYPKIYAASTMGMSVIEFTAECKRLGKFVGSFSDSFRDQKMALSF